MFAFNLAPCGICAVFPSLFSQREQRTKIQTIEKNQWKQTKIYWKGRVRCVCVYVYVVFFFLRFVSSFLLVCPFDVRFVCACWLGVWCVFVHLSYCSIIQCEIFLLENCVLACCLSAQHIMRFKLKIIQNPHWIEWWVTDAHTSAKCPHTVSSFCSVPMYDK